MLKQPLSIQNHPTLLSQSLDRFLSPTIPAWGQSWSPFHLFGAIGFFSAISLTLSLTVHLGLSPSVMVTIIAIALVAFLLQAMLTKILTGREDLVLYRQVLGVTGAIVLLLANWHQPILPYLDIVVLGLGALILWGRIGCLMVGCCHGRPAAWGVRYGEPHREFGFAHWLVGVRLFPIQAIESLWLLGVVLGGIGLILHDHAPGDSVAWCGVVYSVGRFGFEFWRGDVERPYLGSFSEAQWTAVLLVGGIVWAESADRLGLHQWHSMAALGLLLTMMGTVLYQRFQPDSPLQLLRATHIQEIATTIAALSSVAISDQSSERSAAPSIPVCCTSLGIQLSADRIQPELSSDDPAAACPNALHHYTLSSSVSSLTPQGAKTLAELIQQLQHPADTVTLIAGQQNIFHLLVAPGNTN